jgi:hypothetical protein
MIFWSLRAFIWFKNMKKMLLQMTSGFLKLESTIVRSIRLIWERSWKERCNNLWHLLLSSMASSTSAQFHTKQQAIVFSRSLSLQPVPTL